METRLKLIRANLGISQLEFAKALGIGQSTLGMMEVGKREILDRHIKTICSVFNINEDWFRTGKGEMYNGNEISLDAYAKERKLSELELKIIKAYFELDSEIREKLLSQFTKALVDDDLTDSKQVVAKYEEISHQNNNEFAQELIEEDLKISEEEQKKIEEELEDYRKEMESELIQRKKMEKMSSALHVTKGAKIGKTG